MPVIYRIGWEIGKPYEGYDIHLLRGQSSQPLKGSVFVEFDPTRLTKIVPPSLSDSFKHVLGTSNEYVPHFGPLTFTPIYTPGFDPLVTGHGITIDTATGVISTVIGQPARLVPNFLIKVDLPGAPDVTPLAIRVHIHEAILPTLRLSPVSMTVNPSGGAVRFSVLARFKQTKAGNQVDGLIADVSRHPGLSMTVVQGPLVKVDQDNQPDPNGLWLSASGTPSEGTEGKVRMELDFGPPGKATSPDAVVKIGESWSKPRTAKPVLGAPPTAGRILTAPNILFLPDGFTSEADFEEAVLNLVKRLKEESDLEPFGLLGARINYFRLWLPSAGPGTSQLNEVRPDGDFSDEALVVPRAFPPPGDVVRRVEHLIFKVGLPAFSDDVLDDDDRLAFWTGEWARIYNANWVGFGDLPLNDQKMIVRFWERLANRFLLLEQDTFLGLATGRSPQGLGDNGIMLTWHPFRVTRKSLDTLLASVSMPVSGVTTSIWSSATGKDRTLVCALTTGGRAGGRNTRDDLAIDRPEGFPERRERRALIAASLSDESELEFDKTSVTPFMKLVPGDLDTDVPTSALAGVAHETAHSLGCGDEYGSNTDSKIEDDQRDNLAVYGNLQHLSYFDLANTSSVPNEIRWNWNRIRAAAVVREIERPDPTQLTYRFTLRARHGKELVQAFSEDKSQPASLPAYLRPRHLPGLHPTLQDALKSEKLELKKANISGDVVTFTVTSEFPNWLADNMTPERVSRGAVLFIPLTSPSGKELMLVHPKVETHLKGKGNALPAGMNRTDISETNCKPDPRPKQKPEAIAGVRLLTGFGWNKQRLVGLFTGGIGFDCKVFHPAGHCLMRTINEDPAVSGFLSEFCQVCRYIIVDYVDPRRHPLVDKLYKTYGGVD